MAKDAAKTRRLLHPTKDDIRNGAQYLASLSDEERNRVYKARDNQATIFSVLCGIAVLSMPLLLVVLLFS